MKLNAKQKELATKRLWELQEMFTDVEGLVLASIGGLQLTSTMPNSASLQRLTAASTALLLLGEHALAEWSGDQMEGVYVTIKGDIPRYATLYPVGTNALLIIIRRIETKIAAADAIITVKDTVQYLEAILSEL